MMFSNSILAAAARKLLKRLPLQGTHMYAMSTRSLLSQDSYEAFTNSLPNILDNVFSGMKEPETVARLKWITDYNLSGGKLTRPMLALHAYETLEKPENITEESLNQMRVLAWGVEMVHSYFVILDDIEDGAKTRRGKPCWHFLPNVGNQALNDACLIASLLYQMLKQNFMGTRSYVDIRHLFDKAFLYTAIGQHLDINAARTRGTNLDNFTVERYNTIVDYKATYYTIKLPVYLAMTLANKIDVKSCKYLEDICIDFGLLLQIENDYMDCYVENYSTDIQEGKCTWLATTALQRCTPVQRSVFSACYGSKEPAHIERIKRLYDQLHIPEKYLEHRRQLQENILRKTQKLSSEIAFSPDVFNKLLDTIAV